MVKCLNHCNLPVMSHEWTDFACMHSLITLAKITCQYCAFLKETLSCRPIMLTIQVIITSVKVTWPGNASGQPIKQTSRSTKSVKCQCSIKSRQMFQMCFISSSYTFRAFPRNKTKAHLQSFGTFLTGETPVRRNDHSLGCLAAPQSSLTKLGT